MLEDKFGTEFCGNVLIDVNRPLIDYYQKLAKYGGIKDSEKKTDLTCQWANWGLRVSNSKYRKVSNSTANFTAGGEHKSCRILPYCWSTAWGTIIWPQHIFLSWERRIVQNAHQYFVKIISGFPLVSIGFGVSRNWETWKHGNLLKFPQ